MGNITGGNSNGDGPVRGCSPYMGSAENEDLPKASGVGSLATLSADPERMAITFTDSSKSNRKGLITSVPELRLTVVAGSMGAYQIKARYGCTDDHHTLQQSVKEVRKYAPHAEIVYATASDDPFSEKAGGASSELEMDAEVRNISLKLGVPRGATLNGFSPKFKPSTTVEYTKGRLVLVAVIVTVKKGKELAQAQPDRSSFRGDVALEPTPGVAENGLSLVLWREIKVPPPFKDIDVTFPSNRVPLVQATLPTPACVYGLEVQLRKRELWGEEMGPPWKCSNWLCTTAKWDYTKERVAIPAVLRGQNCEVPISSGSMRMEVCIQAESAGATEDTLQSGTYVLRLRGYSLAGHSKWSKVTEFEVP